jgi:hypothetical protein
MICDADLGVSIVGLNLLDIIKNPTGVRGKPIPLSWGGQNGVIDENLKIINRPSFGQCDSQAPYNETTLEDYYLFDVVADYHEVSTQRTHIDTPLLPFAKTKRPPLRNAIVFPRDGLGMNAIKGNSEYRMAFHTIQLHDLKSVQPAEWTRMKKLYDEAMLSIQFSQLNETQCCDAPQPESPEGRFACRSENQNYRRQYVSLKICRADLPAITTHRTLQHEQLTAKLTVSACLRFVCRLGGLRNPPDATRKEITARLPSEECKWYVDTGLDGADIATALAATPEDCCGTCRAIDGCTGVDLSGGRCHLKTGTLKMQPRLGTTSCVPLSH